MKRFYTAEIVIEADGEVDVTALHAILTKGDGLASCKVSRFNVPVVIELNSYRTNPAPLLVSAPSVKRSR